MGRPHHHGKKKSKGRAKNKKSKSKSKTTKRQASSSSSSSSSSAKSGNWVEQLTWKSVLEEEGVDDVEKKEPNQKDDNEAVLGEEEDQSVSSSSTSTTSSSNSLQNINDDEISIISWNVLAESYLSKRSHSGLPQAYQSIIFNSFQRRHLVLHQILKKKIMENEQPDVLCLQEVDLPDIDATLRHNQVYDGLQTPTTKGGGGGRVDACAIYWKTKSWTLQRSKIIQLDDLATLGETSSSTTTSSTTMSKRKKRIQESSLQGVRQSFLRRNTALLVMLQHTRTGKTVVIGNAHLYWHPGYEYVKLCQAHYVMKSIRQFAAEHSPQNSNNNDGSPKLPPILICGDFNSKPTSIVHAYLTKGSVNAKRVAPWYGHTPDESYDDNEYLPPTKDDDDEDDERQHIARDEQQEDQIVLVEEESDSNDSNNSMNDTTNTSNNKSGDGDDDGDDDAIVSGIASMMEEKLHLKSTTTPATKQPTVRYLLDFTLNRFTRWLRILGIDAALETDEEERQRTKHANMNIFDRCRQEKRTLLTTSSKLMLRKDCPPGAYLINPQRTHELEISLVNLLVTHGVCLQPSNFLSRCVVCNGNIETVHDMEKKQRIFADHQAPQHLSQTLQVYACNGCGQGYWWCDRPSSSASRVKNQATKLFERCLRGGVPLVDGDEASTLGMFDYVNIHEQRQKGREERQRHQEQQEQQQQQQGAAAVENNDVNDEGTDGGLLAEHLDVIDWLKDDALKHDFSLQSAYAAKDKHGNIIGEQLPFTNVTRDFVDTLDYVLFDTTQFTQLEVLDVPTSFKRLNKSRVPNGHLLPSNIWPSDHIAIGTRLRFVKERPQIIIEQQQPKVKKSLLQVSNVTLNHDEKQMLPTKNETVNGVNSHHDSMKASDPVIPFCGVISASDGGVNGEGLALSSPPPPPPLIGLETSDPVIPFCGVVSASDGGVNGEGLALSSPPPPPPPIGLETSDPVIPFCGVVSASDGGVNGEGLAVSSPPPPPPPIGLETSDPVIPFCGVVSASDGVNGEGLAVSSPPPPPPPIGLETSDPVIPFCGVVSASDGGVNGEGLAVSSPPPPPLRIGLETSDASDPVIPFCGVVSASDGGVNGEGLAVSSPPPPPPPIGLFSLPKAPAQAAPPTSTTTTTTTTTDNPTYHGNRCACGCVPPILSLFEMAELRKKAREEKKAQQQAP